MNTPRTDFLRKKNAQSRNPNMAELLDSHESLELQLHYLNERIKTFSEFSATIAESVARMDRTVARLTGIQLNNDSEVWTNCPFG